MKLNTWSNETTVEGNIYDGPIADSYDGTPRLAEKYRVSWTHPSTQTPGERIVSIDIFGRRVTKVGTVNKRDSFMYSISSPGLKHRVLKMLWEAGEVPTEVWETYLIERRRG